jgi:hypothetical protein
VFLNGTQMGSGNWDQGPMLVMTLGNIFAEKSAEGIGGFDSKMLVFLWQKFIIISVFKKIANSVKQ